MQEQSFNSQPASADAQDPNSWRVPSATAAAPLYRRRVVWVAAGIAVVAVVVAVTLAVMLPARSVTPVPGGFSGEDDNWEHPVLTSMGFSVGPDAASIAKVWWRATVNKDCSETMISGEIFLDGDRTFTPPLPIDGGGFKVTGAPVSLEGHFTGDGTDAAGTYTIGTCSGSWTAVTHSSP